MTDYCASRNQIKTYAPTASASNTLFAKNIDCVTLEADLVACDTLTVQGVDLSGVTDLTTKTQYQTASGNTTTFAGNVTTSGLTVNQINALYAANGIQLTSMVDQTYGNALGGINLYLVNPTLGTATNSQTMGLHMGTSKTVTNSAWEMLYVNIGSGNVLNRLDFKMAGQTTPTLSLTNGKLGINNTAPAEALDVSGNFKIFGNIITSGGALYGGIGQTFSAYWASTGGLNAYKYENMLANSNLYSSTYYPRVYTFYFTNVKATGFGTTTDKPLFRIGYGGATTTWGTIYSGSVTQIYSNSTAKEEATTSGIPLAPVISGGSWSENYVHSGSFTVTYMTAAGGGYIYKWDLLNTYYTIGGASNLCSNVQGSGYIFGSTSLGRPTAIGLFNGITDTYPTVKLYAQIISAHIV